MKKFLVTLVVIILAISVGFGVFYLVKDNEVISLKAQTIYKDAGEPFEITLDVENPNSYTKITVSSSDESIVKVEDSKVDPKKGVVSGTFTALSGGSAKIVFKTNNAKFRNIGCDVIVCDGTAAYPYRIDSAEELQRIGAADEKVYTTDKHYVLTDNIDLGSLQSFTPIPSLFGTLDGKGYTISNMVISGDILSDVGLIRTIYAGGVVKNLKIEKATINANNKNLNVGVVAGINRGHVELVEVKSATITGTAEAAFVGGVVGLNESTNLRTERHIARIDRVSANVTLGAENSDLLGSVGGVCGDNYGGVIINSYAKGKACVKGATLFGGVVASNRYMEIKGSGTGYDGNLGGKIKDCYSIVVINEEDTSKMGHILAKNIDDGDINKVVGNYYISESSLKGIGTADVVYGEIGQNGTTNAVVDNQLKNMSKLVSYYYYNKKITIVGDSVVVEPDVESKQPYYWSLDAWEIDLTQNDGYPILTYKDEYVSDNFEGSATMDLVDTYAELDAIRNNLNGIYVLSKDIDLSEGGEWTPIGTKEKPFMGQIHIADNNPNGITISNLKITSSGHEYVGLFGVLGSEAYIKGINIANATITGANSYAGAIAGQNNGTIDRCNLVSGQISATVAVGGIAGENNGRICGVSVSAKDDDVITITKLSAKDSLNYGAGGIAGINFKDIVNNGAQAVDNKVNGNVLITSQHNTYLGGVAGQNMGKINLTYVTLTGGKYGITTSHSAIAGGVAGLSTGKITNQYVSAIISVKVDYSLSYAGGIVGSLNAKEAQAISGCVIENSYISANVSGGAVGSMTTEYQVKLNIAKDDFKFNGAQRVTNVDSSTPGTMELVAVENTVTLEGGNSGGLVGHLTKGIVRDCYTKALLSADENAGLVHTISLNKSTKEGGVMFKVYSAASHKQGTSYAVSVSEVHNNWNIGLFLGENSDNRNVGFIFDYYYEGNDKLKNPKVPDPLKGIYELINREDIVYNNRDANEMKTKSLWESILEEENWKLEDGSLPTIHCCEVLKLSK